MAVWFVTGSSRGFGLEIVRAALARGDQVVATARTPSVVLEAVRAESDRLLAVPLDVTEPGTIEAAVSAAVDRFGRIDALVNNAGFGLFGAIEELSDAEARRVFDTNVFGVLNVTRAVLPVLRRQKSGHVLNIGSIGGFVSQPGSGLYGATKFALEAISEALHGEMAPLGVSVTVVEPGAFRTDFLDSSSLRFAARSLPDYERTAGRRRTYAAQNNHQQAGDPGKAAKAIVDVVHSDHPPLRLQLGADSVARVEAKLAAVGKELAEWRGIAESTGF